MILIVGNLLHGLAYLQHNLQFQEIQFENELHYLERQWQMRTIIQQ